MSTAMRIADKEGVVAVTFRRLADDLAVTPMALYRHVRDKEDLLHSMADRVFAETELPAPNLAGRAALAEIARALRGALLAHPWAAGLVTGHVFVSEGSLRLAEAAHAAFASEGVPPAGRVRLYALFSRALLSLALFEIGSGSPQSARERRAALSAVRRQLAALPRSEYPNLVAAAPHVQSVPPAGEAFEDALDLLLDALDEAICRERTDSRQTSSSGPHT